MGLWSTFKSKFTGSSADPHLGVYEMGGNSFLDMSNIAHAYYAYLKAPQVSFPLITRANSFKNAELSLRNRDGEDITGQLSDDIIAKFKKPNKYDNYFTFRAKCDTFVQLFGWCIIYADNDIIGQNPMKANSWHVISPMDLEPVYKNQHTIRRLDNELLGFKAPMWGVSFIPIQSVLLLKSDNINPKNPFLSLGSVALVDRQISNIILAYEIRNSSMVSRGAVGIVSTKSKEVEKAVIMPKLREEIERVKKDYYDNYGMTHGKSPLIFSNAPMGFERIQWSVEDMKLYEEVKESGERVYDVLQTPSELANDSKGSSFANQDTAFKRLYTNAIIPGDRDYFQSVSTWIGLDEKGLSMHSSYTHLEIFQESEKEKAEGDKATLEANLPLYEKNIMTVNQFRDRVDLEPIEGGDVVLSEFSKQPLVVRLGVG
ncbi:phage portal protein, partial [bacterium]|nr:phage portal protein [bacterium]